MHPALWLFPGARVSLEPRLKIDYERRSPGILRRRGESNMTLGGARGEGFLGAQPMGVLGFGLYAL
jgi:hypothetical protein